MCFGCKVFICSWRVQRKWLRCWRCRWWWWRFLTAVLEDVRAVNATRVFLVTHSFHAAISAATTSPSSTLIDHIPLASTFYVNSAGQSAPCISKWALHYFASPTCFWLRNKYENKRIRRRSWKKKTFLASPKFHCIREVKSYFLNQPSKTHFNANIRQVDAWLYAQKKTIRIDDERTAESWGKIPCTWCK